MQRQFVHLEQGAIGEVHDAASAASRRVDARFERHGDAGTVGEIEMRHERVDVDVPRDDLLIVMCPDGDVRERCAPKFHLIEQTLEVPALARLAAGHG